MALSNTDRESVRLRDPLFQGPATWIAAFFSFVVYAGMIAANIYAWSLTVTGLTETHLLPTNAVFVGGVVTWIVAFFVHAAIFGYFLSIQFWSKDRIWPIIYTSILIFTIIPITWMFGLFAINYSSASERVVDSQKAEIGELNRQLQSIDREIVSAVTAHIQSHDGLATRACRGLDESGIRRCGPIALRYQSEANRLRSEYSILARPTAMTVFDQGQSLVEATRTVATNAAVARRRAELFADFARRENQAPGSVAADIAAIDQRIAGKLVEFGGAAPDGSSLTLQRTFDQIGSILKLQARPEATLSVAIAVLPETLSLALAGLLRIMAGGSLEVGVLRSAVAAANRESMWRGRWSDAVEQLKGAASHNNWLRRFFNVQQEVDKSTPDT